MENTKQILVASDNQMFLNHLRSLSTDGSFMISETNLRGSQLKDLIKQNSPQLTILDFPTKSDEKIQQLIDIRRVLDIPVMLLDASSIRNNTVAVVKFDADSAFEQSMSLNNLVTQIKKILGINISGDDFQKNA
jgi:DNA-binding NarL/FixJ family response regulator